MNLKRHIIIVAGLLALTCTAAHAQGPNNCGTYYSTANGKKGEALKTALWAIIKNHTDIGYGGLREAYMITDVRADGYIRDWYSNTTHYVPGSPFGNYSKEGDAYNREHSVPQSWFNEASPMKADIVHVFPVDGYVNNRRSDFPFGEVGTVTYQSNNGYSKLGYGKDDLDYHQTVFEPNDEIKGDIARIYFYMATCYEDKVTSWAGQSFTGPSKYQPFAQWTLDMLMRWSAQDPVDEVELARNEGVYTVQQNRNPFVDYPGLEQYVWGGLRDKDFSYDNYERPAGDEHGPDDTQPDDPIDDTPSESGTIALNNDLFGVSWTGSRPANSPTELTGTQNGVTVTYAMGEGGTNMYVNTNHIRLYQKNTLTFGVGQGWLRELKFNLVNSSSKTLQASVGTVSTDRVWTGKTQEVTFSVNDGSGNMQLASVDVQVENDNTGIATTTTQNVRTVVFHDLQGRRVVHPRRGLYIKDGKKVVVR